MKKGASDRLDDAASDWRVDRHRHFVDARQRHFVGIGKIAAVQLREIAVRQAFQEIAGIRAGCAGGGIGAHRDINQA
ncbi:MAG: hypothetical protein OD817_04010, partial [Gammaproteobacteria bacterium]